ncbi:hypothetical protein NQZ68_036816 [Dissostichus eleginoides]|nr:hypothetical protein NQZ68_036816 [Dissostichus eleginoides]
MRALNPPKDNETQATVGVVFHGTTAIADLPQNDVVAQTLVEALSNSTNIPILSINPASVKVLASPVPDIITTDAPATTPAAAATNTAAPDHNYVLDIQLIGEPFSPALTNPSSKEYKALEKRILNACGNIYRTKYPKTFSHCLLKALSASNVTRVTETRATFVAVFHGNTSQAELPMNSAVIKDFVQAVSNSNNAFNLSINPDSVTILTSPVTDPTTAPTPRPAAPNTVDTATTTAAPITEALIIKRVIFRSLLTDFTSDLLNPSSTAYINRAAMIKEQLTRVFQSALPSSFKSLKVVSFRNGSIINTVDVYFSSTPADSDDFLIASILMSGAASITGFDIEGSSISVNGLTSSGVSHNISLMTASCLAMLSWLLSSQQWQ